MQRHLIFHDGLATGTKLPLTLEMSTIVFGRRLTVGPRPRGGKLQNLRYLVVLVTGFIAGSRVIDAIRSWQEWHLWLERDPSGADAYRTFFLVNVATAALSLAIAVLVWWLLRPRTVG
jgi:hypothetical protein